MTAPRSTKEEFVYRRHLKADKTKDCPFCEMQPGHPQFVRETNHLKVVRNRVPYSLWDNQKVLEHLMVVPKKHTDKLGDLGDAAAVEFIKLIDEYESTGYNIYARAVDSSNRSVKHQHTHLMKLAGKEVNFLFMMRKPWYFRLSK
jgi:diadenosine tetraphosphate (Ap4A) HIT family hydrolase